MNSQRGNHPPGGPHSGKGVAEGAASSKDSDADKDSSKPSGRVAFDSRGNSIWEWQTEEPGKFSRDVNTHYIKKLEAPELSLDESSSAGKVERPETQSDDPRGSGFNPYDRGSLSSGSNTNPNAESAPARKPIKDLRRYNEWLKLKQRLAENKDKDE
jgi:hypothetical protein